MTKPLSQPRDEPSLMAKLVPAPISTGTTVTGCSGVMLLEAQDAAGVPIISIGIASPDGTVIAALFDIAGFDALCMTLSPLVERATARLDRELAWKQATVQ